MTRLAVPQAAAAASAFELIELELEDFVVARDLAPATEDPRRATRCSGLADRRRCHSDLRPPPSRGC